MLNKKEKEAMKKEWEDFKAAHPKKEGKKNFKALSKPEQWEIEEDYPLVRKHPETGRLEIRRYIGYFPDNENTEEDSKKFSIVSTYDDAMNIPVLLTFIASFIGAAYVSNKYGKKFIIKYGNKLDNLLRKYY